MKMESSRLPVPVLTYHKIGTPKEGDSHPRTYLSETSFARQMKMLAFLGYQTVSPVDLLALKVTQTKPPCRKPILLTFDDASVTVHATAWPIMKSYGFTGTVFITYQTIGQSPAWDNDSHALMGKSQIQDLLNSGWTLGSHTLTHPSLSAQSQDRLDAELIQARQLLEKDFSCPVPWFAYPYGHFDAAAKKAVSRAGYQIGFATDFGDGSLAAIPRRTVKQGKLFLRELLKAKRLSLR